MKRLTLSALVAIASSPAASAGLAQDVAAGKTSFNKCMACYAGGEGAKNKVGPELNGSTAATPARLRVIPIRTPTRIPASPGTRPNSRTISKTPRRRFPAPRWYLPESRTRRRLATSGRFSRNTTRTERPGKAPSDASLTNQRSSILRRAERRSFGIIDRDAGRTS